MDTNYSMSEDDLMIITKTIVERNVMEALGDSTKAFEAIDPDAPLYLLNMIIVDTLLQKICLALKHTSKDADRKALHEFVDHIIDEEWEKR